ncbi:hypothetical protein [Nocardiopsis dassonvillei]|uniref:hypothetical protein n=1 Tax=Nocardiopsis dassonvillei TaxID=2014 RepID=UPI0036732B08
MAASRFAHRTQRVGRDDAASLAPPEVLAAEIVEDTQAVLAEFAAIAEPLGDVKEQEICAE